MREATFDGEKFTLVDTEILEVFEKQVTPHGTGGKIPCSSKLIGKTVYVIVKK